MPSVKRFRISPYRLCFVRIRKSDKYPILVIALAHRRVYIGPSYLTGGAGASEAVFLRGEIVNRSSTFLRTGRNEDEIGEIL